MIIVYALLALVLVCISYALFRISLSYFKQMRTIQEDRGLFIDGIVMGLLGIAVSILAVWSFAQMGIAIEHKGTKYPASEYRIETEITTRGDVSDTTYVVIKKIKL